MPKPQTITKQKPAKSTVNTKVEGPTSIKGHLIEAATNPINDNKARGEAVFKLFALGLSLPEIAEKTGRQYHAVWKQIKLFADRLDSTNPTPTRLVVHQQYVLLTRIADQAMLAWDRSIQRGTFNKETSTDDGKDAITRTHTKRMVTPGESEYLKIAMDAMKQVRDLFGIGVAADDGKGSVNIGLGVNIKTSWGTPVDFGAAPAGGHKPQPALEAASRYIDERPPDEDDDDQTNVEQIPERQGGIEISDMSKMPR